MVQDRPGKLIAGRYELLEPAGEGGMATVWRALSRDPGAPNTHVAVKRIHATKGGDPHFVRLFEEEARVGSHLHHRNIVEILDFGVDDEGDYYLVMEWVEGLDLHQWVRSHPRGLELTPWPLVAAIGVQVLEGLAAAHERAGQGGQVSPIYHRDVSPSNVLLSTDGGVKLTDFGLARAMDRGTMTRPNVIKGKLAYCAPEMVMGAAASPQSDIFAVGVVLWESLAQGRLFTGKNDLEVLFAVRKGEIPSLAEVRHDVPGRLSALVQRALTPDPADRFETAAAMARQMAAVLDGCRTPPDAAALGGSVQQARDRLGIAARARAAARVRSHEELSLRDLELIDEARAAGLDIRVSSVPDQPLPDPKSVTVHGLWNDGTDEKG